MKQRIGFVVVALVALALRLYGLSWDSGTHLHPDERFLTMVADSIRFPSAAEYFDTARSTANPHNVGHSFYVYGTLPLFLFRAAAVATGNASYAGLVTVQRAISAVADTITALLVALLAFRLAPETKRAKAALLAGLLYAFLPFAIQQAHFGTVDTLGTLFVMAAVAAAFVPGAVTFARAIGVGAAIGAATACKPNLPAYAAVVALAWLFSKGFTPSTWARLGAAGATSLLVFRVAQPYAFSGPGFFGVAPNPKWLENLAQLKGLLSLDSWYAPGVQWVDRVFLLEAASNLLVWATGPALGLLLFLVAVAVLTRGLLALEPEEERPLFARLLAVFAPVVALLVWQLSRPVATVRYAHPALPLLVAASAAALPLLLGRFARLAGGVTLIGTVLAGFALLSIYSKETTRVTATRRLAALFPGGATIAFEHWDDPIPLSLPDVPWDRFHGVEMPVFDADSTEKAAKLVEALDRVDAVVVTSRRGFGTITRLPDTFPITSEYYRLLYSGALGFDLAARIESRPGIGRFRLDDRAAEEALSVYDHPQVLIFKKTPAFSRELAERLIFRVASEPADPAAPRDALARGTPPDLSPEELAKGVHTPAPPKRRGLLGQLASLAAWIVALEMLGVLGAAVLSFCGEGVATATPYLARPLGFTLAGLGTSALGYVAPGFQALARPIFFVSIALVVFVPLLRRAFVSIGGRARVVFLSLFAVFLLVRAFNPEIFWGEKPMDAAILGTAIRAPRLPLAEPWFAGAPLDYYGHGFLPVAALSHATAASPGLAFNLAVATLPALLGVAVYGAGALLSGSGFGGTAALVLVLLSGTLAPLFNTGFRAAPFSFDGFWAASRVIPDAINEFPLFTALFADLHAHLLGWAPFSALLLLSLALRLAPPPPGSHRAFFAAVILGLAATACHLTDPWESPLAAVLVVAALVPSSGPRRFARLAAALAVAGTTALLAALPTLLHVRSVPVAFTLHRGEHSSALAYLELLGAPLLVAALAWVVVGPRSSGLKVAFGVAALALAVLLFAEVFVVADRMNTLFKFGLQGRILLGLAAGSLAPALVETCRRKRRFVPALAGVVTLVTVLAGVAHVAAVIRTRRVPGPRPALDGFAHVDAYDPAGAREMDEKNAKRGWPVIVEAPGDPYSAHLQTTMRTGCPTIVGWPWHLAQRRRSPLEVSRRKLDVEWMLTSGNEAFRDALRKSYGVHQAPEPKDDR